GALGLEPIEAGLDLRILVGRERVDRAEVVEPPAQVREAAHCGRLARWRRLEPGARRGRPRPLEFVGGEVVGRGGHVRFRHRAVPVAPSRVAAGSRRDAEVPQRDLTQAGQLSQELFAEALQREASLDLLALVEADTLLDDPQALASGAHLGLRRLEALPVSG